MLIGCFFWAAFLGARVIFGAIPTLLPYCLISVTRQIQLVVSYKEILKTALLILSTVHMLCMFTAQLNFM